MPQPGRRAVTSGGEGGTQPSTRLHRHRCYGDTTAASKKATLFREQTPVDAEDRSLLPAGRAFLGERKMDPDPRLPECLIELPELFVPERERQLRRRPQGEAVGLLQRAGPAPNEPVRNLPRPEVVPAVAPHPEELPLP